MFKGAEGYNGCMQTRHKFFFFLHSFTFSWVLQGRLRDRDRISKHSAASLLPQSQTRHSSQTGLKQESAVAGKTGTRTATYMGPGSLEGMSISTHTTAQCKLLSSWRMHNMQGALTPLQLFTLRACQRHRYFISQNVMKLLGVKFKEL